MEKAPVIPWEALTRTTSEVSSETSRFQSCRIWQKAYVQPLWTDRHGKKVSFAELFREILACEDRVFGVKGYRKHAKREANAKLTGGRHYHVVHHGNLEQEVKDNMHRIKLEHSKFAAKGFNVGPQSKAKKLLKGIKRRDGSNDQYGYYACPELGLGTVMSRRYPCGCKACDDTLKIAWVWDGRPILDQPRFQRVQNCKFAEVFEDLNEWKV